MALDIHDIAISKLSGSGNDFLCIDSREGQFDALLAAPAGISHFARTLCRRDRGVGADGLIFAVRPEINGVADLGARFFEPDGSEAELCGNGTACFTRWAIDAGWRHDDVRILTTAGVVIGKPSDGLYYRVCIPLPENIHRHMTVDVNGQNWDCDEATVGVPHLIVYVEDLPHLDITRWGPLLRHHPQFQPRGINANFVRLLGEGELALRTWEFGVEGETLACGTGSAAAAVLASLRAEWGESFTRGKKPVLVHARSGDILRIYFNRRADGHIDELCLETQVRYLFTGHLHPDAVAAALAAT